MKEIKIVFKIPEVADLLIWLKTKLSALAAFLWSLIKKAGQDIAGKKYRTIFIAAIAILLFWKLSLTAAIFLGLFAAFILYPWDSRILAGGALVSLATCPFLLAAGKDSAAETMAVYAYYFLAMTVGAQTIEFAREKSNAPAEKTIDPEYANIVSGMEAEFSSPALRTPPGFLEKTKRQSASSFLQLKYWIKRAVYFSIRTFNRIFAGFEALGRAMKKAAGAMQEFISAKEEKIDPEISEALAAIEKEMSSPNLSAIRKEEEQRAEKPIADYSGYLDDLKAIENAGKSLPDRIISLVGETAETVTKKFEAGIKHLPIVADNTINSASAAWSEIIVRWTKDALRITWNAVAGNASALASRLSFLKIVLPVQTRGFEIECPRIFRTRKHNAPDFLPDTFLRKTRRYIRAIAIWPMAVNAALLILSSVYVRENLISGDTVQLAIKLALSAVLIILFNLMIRYNRWAR